MNPLGELEEVLGTEIELSETLLATLDVQCDAIIHLDHGVLTEAVQRGEELAGLFNALEKERQRVTKDRWGGVIALRDLASRCPAEEGARLLMMGERLKATAEHISARSKQNAVLLEHSLRFVRDNIKIITENFSRPLVDQRM